MYTRTRDFYRDFCGQPFPTIDEVILVDIYPWPVKQLIPGVTSKLIYDNLRPGIENANLPEERRCLKDKNIEVLVVLGPATWTTICPQNKGNYYG